MSAKILHHGRSALENNLLFNAASARLGDPRIASIHDTVMTCSETAFASTDMYGPSTTILASSKLPHHDCASSERGMPLEVEGNDQLVIGIVDENLRSLARAMGRAAARQHISRGYSIFEIAAVLALMAMLIGAILMALR